MPTLNQIKVIQAGKRALDLSDPQYRTILRNVAHVESSKELTNVGVEDVLAVLEDMGFDSHPAGPTHWRNKVAARATYANARLVFKIRELAVLQRYDLGAQVLKFSGGRSELPEHLHPYEAHGLIEMLKAAVKREAAKTDAKPPDDWDVLCHGCGWRGREEGTGSRCPKCGAAENMLFERMPDAAT